MRMLFAIFFMSSATFVDATHHVELSGGFGFGEQTYEENGYSDRKYGIDAVDFSAKFYFGPIEAERGPIREFGFLSQRSNVNLNMTRYSKELDADSNISFDGDGRSISGRFVFPRVPIFVGVAVLGADIEYSDGEKSELDGHGFLFGGYLTDLSALWFDYIEADTSSTDELYSERNREESSINYKHVSFLRGRQSLAWTLRLENSSTSSMSGYVDRKSLGGSLKFYITEKLGFGAGLRIDDYDINDRNYGLGVEGTGAVFTPEFSYDFHENVGMYINVRSEAITYEYESSFYDDESISEVIYSMGLNVRF